MSNELITEVDILDESKECFLVYAEEVLTDRAIPSAEDGLLSSQRKIIWTMEDYLKMNSKSKTKKCNGIIGSTLSTSYFHGDLACYDVLRKLSQPFLMRYPLIDGQGSLGTQESNDMFSSSRYTEAKPSIYADLMMNDFKKNVVPLKETYNGEFMEPIILPSLFPNALCNGKQAIGISMAHNSQPNNLTEVCNAAIRLLSQGSLTVDELLEIMPGPDFPLPCTVINKQDIREAFATGKSKTSLKVRGKYEIKGQDIIFTTIPYRTYRNKIKEQITKNVEVFDGLLDSFDDESALGQNRLIFHVKKEKSISTVLNKIFHLTDLQTSISYNMNYIVNGTPKLCSMIDLLQAYVQHQDDVLLAATKFDKQKAEERAHILEGLIAAVDKIDEVIALIKNSNDKASAIEKLIGFLSIDEIQAHAILDMKLGKLTRIDKDELIDELKEKQDIIKYCTNLINSKKLRDNVLIQKITDLRDKYGDERRTELTQIDISKNPKEQIVADPKDCVVVVSNRGIVKRVDAKLFKPQKRNTIGTKTNEEIVTFSQKTNTQDALMIFTSKGKMYKILVDNIPESKLGVAISSLVEFDDGEIPMAYTTCMKDNNKKFIFFATKGGIIKKVPLKDYDTVKRTGVVAIKFRDGDELAAVTFIDDEEIIMATKNGTVIRIATSEMPISSRIAQGVKGMNVADGDEVIAALPVTGIDSSLVVITTNNLGKKIDLKDLITQNRGGRGVLCAKSEVAGVTLVNDNDKIAVRGNNSAITINSTEIPTLSRTSIGNIMLKNNNKVISITKV